MNIIGQDKLLNYINSIPNARELPKTIMLVGENGSGKHLIVNYIAERFKLPIKDISDDISYDTIENIMTCPTPTLYCISTHNITEKEQNMILKLLEEPLNNTFICLLCNNIINILDTVKNRCLTIELQHYKKSDLLKFIPEGYSEGEMLLEISSTPGQVIQNSSQQISYLNSMAHTLITKMDVTNVANLFKTSLLFNMKKEDTGKYELSTFLNLVLYWAKKYYIDTSEEKYHKYFLITSKMINDYNVPYVDKRMLYESYLVKLKAVTVQ